MLAGQAKRSFFICCVVFFRTFKIYDDDGNKKLCFDELKTGLQDYGVQLTDDEMHMVFDEFDKDGNGSISFDEFLFKVRVSNAKVTTNG